MTQVADFLLQPATGRATGASPSRAPLGAAQRTDSGQDFSRLLTQQRQQADQRAPASAPAAKPAAPAAKAAQQTAAQEQPERAERKHSQETNSEQRSSSTETDTDTERQKIDSHSEVVEEKEQLSEEEQPQADAENSTLPPSQLNPLSEQIRQLTDEEGELPGPETAEDAVAMQDFLAMLNGAPVTAMVNGEAIPSSEGVSSLGQVNRLLQPLDEGRSGAIGREEGQAGVSRTQLAQLAQLEEAVGEEGEAKLQLLSGAVLRQESTAGSGQGQSLQAARLEGAGEARTDTLMRSEAVQSTQAARQVPGQPLNMQQPGWSKELTDKVMWMSSQNLKSAEIKMNPAELGRLEIRVQVGQESTQISFSSAHAGVRDSLDGQMHRLREMLEQQGMNNVDVEVSGQSPQQQEQQAAGGRAGQTGEETTNDEQLVAVSELDAQSAGHSGLVSHYV